MFSKIENTPNPQTVEYYFLQTTGSHFELFNIEAWFVPTYSGSLNHSAVVVENGVQAPKAGINISYFIFQQDVAPAEVETVVHSNKALKAAQTAAKQQTTAHKPQQRSAHFQLLQLTRNAVFIWILTW